jgi:2-methylcitrate dehydratase PrpD
MSQKATLTLGRFAAGLDAATVEPAIAAKLKLHLLDALGVACAGLSDTQGQAVARAVERWGGTPEAHVVGYPFRLPAPKAAFLNTLHARILTFDDTFERGPAHLGSCIAFSALAAAERAGASGAALLAALLAGHEVGTRVSAALGPSHYRGGFHGTGTCSPFAAAAAAARAPGLDADRIAAALALAGEAAAGFRQYQEDGSLLDTALNAARGAELGVGAAEFAAAGASGPSGILDGRWGLLAITSSLAEPRRLTDGLGERWEFLATTLKPYASCRFTHGPIETIAAAGIDPADVEAVTIVTFRESCDVSNRPDPRHRGEAILSHQVAAALALLGRPIMPAAYEAVAHDVRALAARVTVRHDPALDAAYPATWPHLISVALRDGRRVELRSDRPPGADPATVRAKFAALAEPVLGAANARRVEEMVARVETIRDVRELMALVGGGMRAAA